MRMQRVVVLVAAYVLFVIALGAVYIVAQHDGRSSAEDAPRVLLSAADTVGQPDRLDLAVYQGVFWIRYGSDDRPVDGNGYLDGALAAVPSGVLDTARRLHEDAVTWQPQPGLRFAIVAQPRHDGVVVVAGQSLSRTELRAAQTLAYVGVAAVVGLVVIGIALAADIVLGRGGRRT